MFRLIMFPSYRFRARNRRHAPRLTERLLPSALQDTCREFAAEAGSKAKFGVFMDATHMVLRHARTWIMGWDGLVCGRPWALGCAACVCRSDLQQPRRRLFCSDYHHVIMRQWSAVGRF